MIPEASALVTLGGEGSRRRADVFLFNPFVEGYVGGGRGFTPVRHQVMLAEDLENLPQFLCEAGDMVLVGRRPSLDFLRGLGGAGFPVPRFVEFSVGETDRSFFRDGGNFRPWGWGPDSAAIYAWLVAGGLSGGCGLEESYHVRIGGLYSKVWSCDFLRRMLGGRGSDFLCREEEVGIGVRTLGELREAISVIRGRGHHRVVVKEEYGVAGQQAIRLWEDEVLPKQWRWMEGVLGGGGRLVVEPWLEREMDFSLQLEMGTKGLRVCGYTGLLNDVRGQFMASWAEADCDLRVPSGVRKLFASSDGAVSGLADFYAEIVGELEVELGRVGFLGPVGIDAFIYREAGNGLRVKPVVEINPRYTMGRVMLELRKRFMAGSCGIFRLVKLARVRAAGHADFGAYARWLRARHPLRVEGGAGGGILEGALCLNDPERAQVCLAVLQVGTVGEVSRLGGVV